MKTIEKIVVFLCAYLFCGWGTLFVQNANADSSTQKLRVFAYDLNYEFEQDENSVLGTYTFHFKSNVAPISGSIIFYSESGQKLGDRALSDAEIVSRTAKSNYTHTVVLTSAELAQITGNTAYLNMKWGVRLVGEKIFGQYGEDNSVLLRDTSKFTLTSYQTEGQPLYKQVREPNLIFEDNNLQAPQSIAIDNNPQSPFFGRVYVANTPFETGSSNGKHAAGVLVYEPDPANESYKKLAGSYMPSVANYWPNEYKRWFMHRIAVNPTNGHVYCCKSTTSVFSAIYELIPTKENNELLTDNGTAINITKDIIPESTVNRTEGVPLHPLNSLAFGPGGELYVMSYASGGGVENSSTIDDNKDIVKTNPVSDEQQALNDILEHNDHYKAGNGKIYELTDSDGDGIINSYKLHYNPRSTVLFDPANKQYGFPYCISPWVNADNSMLVTARGSFWVSQRRDKEIDAYSFLSHILPADNTYVFQEQPGRGLADNFQYSLGVGVKDTYSGNTVIPSWSTSEMLPPHRGNSDLYKDICPSGQIAIYEKNGMLGKEALLAVGFDERVSVFKVIYNEKKGQNWFGFNMDWMFEIPFPGAKTIDGLAFDYAGNLFVATLTDNSTKGSLKVYSLPNYNPIDTTKVLKPTVFQYDKHHVNQNSIHRGWPIRDNNTTTVISNQILSQKKDVDGAIVFHNESGDNQWANGNNWNISRLPKIEDVPVVIRADANITCDTATASGVVLERNVGEKRNSHITITQHGGLTVGKGGITGAATDGSSITIRNYSGWDQRSEDRGAGYLRIDPAINSKNNPERIPNVTVNYITKSTPSKHEDLKDDNNHRLWQYFGAPGDSTKITISNHTWIYQWNDTNQTWVDKGLGTITLDPFKGCAITQAYMPSYEWTTTPINQNHEVSWLDGDYIFDNSFLAPINVAKFDETDFGENVDKTFYIFNTGSWSEWRASVDSVSDTDNALTESQQSGQYTAIPVLSAKNLTENTTIAPMQGVYVRSKGPGKIKLNYAEHVWNTETPGTKPMRSPEKTISPDLLRRIRIQAYGKNSGSDRMYILQDMRCTPDYDNGYDGKNINAKGQVNIYTNEPCGKMEISSTNQIDGMYIGFRAGQDTTYTLRFTSLIGDSLCIKDLANDSIIPLYEDSTYTFYAAAKSVNNMRFQVLLHPNPADDYSDTDNNSGTTTDLDNVSTSQLWMADQHLCISNQMANSTAKIYSVSGQLLISEKFNYQIDIPVYNLTTGVYILEVNNERYKFIRQN